MARWRSTTLLSIPLGALALAAISSCGPAPPLERQNSYATRAECLRDYEERYCQRGRSGGVSAYFGPYYRSDTQTANDPGPGRTAENGQSRAASGVHAARGGFGSTGGHASAHS